MFILFAESSPKIAGEEKRVGGGETCRRVGVSACRRVGVGIAPQGDVSADGRMGVSAWVSPPQGDVSADGRVGVGKRMACRRGYRPPRRRIGGWADGRVGVGIAPQGDVLADGRVGVGIIPQGSVGRRRGIGRDYVVGRGHAGSPGSGGASSVTPLRQNAHPPTRFPSGRGVRFSEDKELHEDKGDQGRWRNCEKLGD
jgi:hypothetical protein